MIDPAIELSIVIPVHNEEAVLPQLIEELGFVLEGQLRSCNPVEVLLVNDGSEDGSWELIAAACDRDPRFVGINLSRNFGHQLALAAGLEQARGQLVVTMDADLQDPPDIIPRMVEAHRQGYEVVHATRVHRGAENWAKRTTARLFYWLIEKISGTPIHQNTGDFRLMSRRALGELAKMRESHRFLRGLVPWLGFPQTQVYYDRADRAAGATHYPWHKMLLLAFDGIASMSRAPLRLAYVLGLFLLLGFVTCLLWDLYSHFFSGGPLVSGSAMVVSVVMLVGAIQLLVLGIFGEYLGRIYEQAKQRPLYIIQEIKRTETERPPRLEKAKSESLVLRA